MSLRVFLGLWRGKAGLPQSLVALRLTGIGHERSYLKSQTRRSTFGLSTERHADAIRILGSRCFQPHASRPDMRWQGLLPLLNLQGY
jgi:hypothetical protein